MDVATELLREAGHRVEAFSSPAAARDAVLAEAPAVLLTDHQMPGCTGIDLARALQSRLRGECPYIVLWTGAPAMVPAHEHHLVDAIVQKPCRIANLLGPAQRGVRLRRRRSSGVQAVSCAALDRAGHEDVG